jgi:N-dimethylarginine dimethylaminohydrolase
MDSDDMQSSTTQPDAVQTQTQTQTQTMTGDLVRVLVCSPRNAGWNQPDKAAAWRDLGFHHPVDFPVAQSQHDRLFQLLSDAGAEVIELAPSDDLTLDDLTLDAVYTHDASLAANDGLILMNPGKRSRFAETRRHREQCAKAGIAMLGEIQDPGVSEAGDIVWLDPETLLVGNGYRTNKAGIDQLRAMLAPRGVEVLSAPLPYGPGPSECLHLMSLMSMLDQKTILVDLSWLAVETVELLRARNFRLIEIDDSERDSLACNVLSVGSNRLIALEENVKTNRRLRDSGFDVRMFPGSELCLNGSGGPTCLTRPLQRR